MDSVYVAEDGEVLIVVKQIRRLFAVYLIALDMEPSIWKLVNVYVIQNGWVQIVPKVSNILGQFFIQHSIHLFPVPYG